MGVLSILGIILILVLAIWMPFIGIPAILIAIVVGVIYYFIKGGVGLTSRGIKAISSRASPTVPGETTNQYCTECNTRLLKIPNENGLWCTTCKAWYD